MLAWHYIGCFWWALGDSYGRPVLERLRVLDSSAGFAQAAACTEVLSLGKMDALAEEEGRDAVANLEQSEYCARSLMHISLTLGSIALGLSTMADEGDVRLAGVLLIAPAIGSLAYGVVVFYRRKNALERASYAVHALVSQAEVAWLDPEDLPDADLDRLLLNVNEPADLERLRR